jgi:hypothetical protein
MPGGPVAWTRYVFRTVASVPLYLQVLITSVQLVVFLGAATSALVQALVVIPVWVSRGSIWFSLGLGWVAWVYERLWLLATDARQQARVSLRLGHEVLGSVHLFWRTLASIRNWQRKLWLPNRVAGFWRRGHKLPNTALGASNEGASAGTTAGHLGEAARFTRVPLWNTGSVPVLYLERTAPMKAPSRV